ncbi:hypothetical protein L798_14520 [Zootermopsis nevadensis]|uniref:Uncharacterized protein n=1 Tax=Zootermopsis nevadensis TaxID=136037 RepID=A0A067QPC6_ZOONE|nr:hypothetical protein L798_14520 [Zootermopsis nevadensis]
MCPSPVSVACLGRLSLSRAAKLYLYVSRSSSAHSRLRSQPELKPARKKRTRGDDTVTDFFLRMAETVKTFPPFLQAQVKNKVFTAVNSAKLMMHNLGNLCKTVGTSDYLIPPAVNSQELPV